MRLCLEIHHEDLVADLVRGKDDILEDSGAIKKRRNYTGVEIELKATDEGKAFVKATKSSLFAARPVAVSVAPPAGFLFIVKVVNIILPFILKSLSSELAIGALSSADKVLMYKFV